MRKVMFMCIILLATGSMVACSKDQAAPSQDLPKTSSSARQLVVAESYTATSATSTEQAESTSSTDTKRQPTQPTPATDETSSQTTTPRYTYQKPESAETSHTPQVDAKNLTTAQVSEWVFLHMRTNKAKFTQADYRFRMYKDATGELVINVHENHDTPAMQAAGADPATEPRIASYRIDHNGHLLEDDYSGRYTLLSTKFGQ